jgi:diguanylate cyclase (GGDEF)-like protein
VEYQSVGRDISESKRLEEELRYMSTHDMLTGIYNRAFFETELKRLERSRLYPISILMVDVNGLKSTNDTQGHASGDELLQTAAQVLSACFRPEDIVARFGGDEFAVLLPGLDETAAADVLARVRASQDRYNQSSTNFNLSLSIGISTADKGDTLLDVLSKADRQMYLDKGRQKGTRELNGRGN